MCLKIFEVPTVIMQRYYTDVRMKQSLKVLSCFKYYRTEIFGHHSFPPPINHNVFEAGYFLATTVMKLVKLYDLKGRFGDVSVSNTLSS